jgi:superfamily II DNA helicase RecQ
MKFRFFAIPARSPEAGEQALNAFCAEHRVLSVEKELVADGGESYWAICVCYLEGADSVRGALAGKRERIDYKAVLSEQDFAVYAELRNLRKSIAEQEGVPAYALFTNEQLAEMVTRRATTLAALGEIEGVGKARLEKYGKLFLAPLERAFAQPQPDGSSESGP